MQQRTVGHSGLTVSRVGLGTLTWGATTDDHEAGEQLAAFRDAGGTLIDTAASYGNGVAEQMLGSLLSEVPRDEVVVATKAGVRTRPDRAHAAQPGASRGHLLRTLDASLSRLGLDHVDLWQVQVWDDRVPLEETLSAVEIAVTSGRVGYVGLSHFTGWQAARAATLQEAAGRTRLVSCQAEYSLLNRDAEHELAPACDHLGLGVLAHSPLARGVLTGKYRHGIPGNSRAAHDEWAGYVAPYLDGDFNQTVEAVVKAAEGLGWSAAEVALTWVRDQPSVDAAILGARDAAQLRQVLRAETRTLPAEIADALADVSAG